MMPRIKPLLPAALLLGLGLASCEATQDMQDKFTGALHDFNPMGTAKRPLPGNRKALFPEGVPGVQQGIPTELMPGAQTAAAAPEPPPEPPPVAKPAKRRPARTAAAPTQPKPQRRAPRRAVPQDPPPDGVWPAPPSAQPAPPPARPAPTETPWQAPPSTPVPTVWPDPPK